MAARRMTPAGAGRLIYPVLAWLLTTGALSAQPTLTHLHPVAAQAGTTQSITALGKWDAWPPQVWVDTPAITFKPAKDAGKFDVEIAKDAVVGPHLVRLFDAKGASAPRFFIVSREPELLEAEPNDEFRAPQRIAKLPASICGKLDKAGDVDSFAVTLQRGQTLVASLAAYSLGSTFDGLLRLVDTNGVQFAFNHDGRTLDPLLTWAAPRDGTFVVQVMGFVYPATASVNLTGGDGCVYRLHLTTDTAAQSILTSPAGRKLAEVSEQEPNDTASTAQSIAVPSSVKGSIEKAGDEDRFKFTAVKQQAYELKLIAARAGSALDAWLKVEDKDGKELARNDDAEGSRDPRLTWTAPGDGEFVVAVGEVTHRGGGDYTYRLEIAEAAPSVTATVANYFFSVQPGRTNEIKVNVKRANGFASQLRLAAKGVPPGVTAPKVDVPEKAGEVTFKLIAGADARPVNQPLELVLREAGSSREHAVRYFMTTTSENNGVPQGYTELVIDSTDQLWLTVSTEPPATPKKKKK